jgi:hypothetical protein
VKCIDGGGGRRREADVQARLVVCRDRTLGGDNPERDSMSPIPVTDEHPGSSYTAITERLQRRVVEALTSFDIAHPD